MIWFCACETCPGHLSTVGGFFLLALHVWGIGVTSLATCRYLVFFSPLDMCYNLCCMPPVTLTLWIIKELSRAKKVYSGVTSAAELYPESILIMAIVGMFKGKGV